MKFTCSLSSFRNEIEHALSFTAQKNSLVITSNVLLETSSDTLTIRATDTKEGFSSTIPVETIIPGATTVYCSKLAAVLKMIPDGDIEVGEEDRRLIIRPVGGEGKINISLKTIPAESFPLMLEMDDFDTFDLPSKEFLSMIDKTSFAVSDDQARIFLTGVYIEKREGKLAMVATDGRKLAYILKAFDREIPEFKGAIVPVRFLQLAKEIIDGDGIFTLKITDDHIFIRKGERLIYSTLILGCEYPNYQRVIPQSFRHVCKMRKDDLEKAINLTSVFVETKSKRLFLDISYEGVLMSVDNNEFGDSRYVIPCEYDGESLRMSFNSSVLIMPVKKVDSEFLKFCFNEPSQAMVIYPEPERDYLFVLMPMQV